jgi:hypothetical protein
MKVTNHRFKNSLFDQQASEISNKSFLFATLHAFKQRTSAMTLVKRQVGVGRYLPLIARRY